MNYGSISSRSTTNGHKIKRLFWNTVIICHISFIRKVQENTKVKQVGVDESVFVRPRLLVKSLVFQSPACISAHSVFNSSCGHFLHKTQTLPLLSHDQQTSRGLLSRSPSLRCGVSTSRWSGSRPRTTATVRSAATPLRRPT